jgi:hypothetical protein
MKPRSRTRNLSLLLVPVVLLKPCKFSAQAIPGSSQILFIRPDWPAVQTRLLATVFLQLASVSARAANAGSLRTLESEG